MCPFMEAACGRSVCSTFCWCLAAAHTQCHLSSGRMACTIFPDEEFKCLDVPLRPRLPLEGHYCSCIHRLVQPSACCAIVSAPSPRTMPALQARPDCQHIYVALGAPIKPRSWNRGRHLQLHSTLPEHSVIRPHCCLAELCEI